MNVSSEKQDYAQKTTHGSLFLNFQAPSVEDCHRASQQQDSLECAFRQIDPKQIVKEAKDVKPDHRQWKSFGSGPGQKLPHAPRSGPARTLWQMEISPPGSPGGPKLIFTREPPSTKWVLKSQQDLLNRYRSHVSRWLQQRPTSFQPDFTYDNDIPESLETQPMDTIAHNIADAHTVHNGPPISPRNELIHQETSVLPFNADGTTPVANKLVSSDGQSTYPVFLPPGMDSVDQGPHPQSSHNMVSFNGSESGPQILPVDLSRSRVPGSSITQTQAIGTSGETAPQSPFISASAVNREGTGFVTRTPSSVSPIFSSGSSTGTSFGTNLTGSFGSPDGLSTPYMFDSPQSYNGIGGFNTSERRPLTDPNHRDSDLLAHSHVYAQHARFQSALAYADQDASYRGHVSSPQSEPPASSTPMKRSFAAAGLQQEHHSPPALQPQPLQNALQAPTADERGWRFIHHIHHTGKKKSKKDSQEELRRPPFA